MRLELDPSEYSLVRMLRDTEDSMTIVLLVEDSLGTNRRHKHALVKREMVRAALGMRLGNRQSHWEYATDVPDSDISDDDLTAVRRIRINVQ